MTCAWAGSEILTRTLTPRRCRAQREVGKDGAHVREVPGRSYPEDHCRIVAYTSHGPAVTSIAGTSIKLEPSDEAAPELPERAEGVGSAGLADGYMVHEGGDGGSLAPKRGSASVGGGSGVRKRAKCAHGRQESYRNECGGSAICAHGRIKYEDQVRL